MLKNKLKKQQQDKAKGSWVKNKFKSLDIYGESVSLTYNGSGVYQTCFGAWVTVLILMTVFAFSAYKTFRLFNRVNPDMATLNMIRDLSEEDVVRAQDYGFDIAFKVWGDLDPAYGNFVFNHVNYVYQEQEDGSTKRNKIKTAIEIEKCNYDNFNFNDTKKLDVIGFEDYYCAKNKMYEVQGNYYTEDFQYLEFKVYPCDDSDLEEADKFCKTPDEIESYWSGQTLSMFWINTYFDFTSYNEPVKHVLDDALYFPIDVS
jgi:hypothetical protein